MDDVTGHDCLDEVWRRLRLEAEDMIRSEPLLLTFVRQNLLDHGSLAEVLAHRIAVKLASAEIDYDALHHVAATVMSDAALVRLAALRDLMAVYARDPACHSLIQPVLFFKGFQALQCHRVSHWLWETGQKNMAYLIQMRVSEVFAVDIHPAARLGPGLMIDHGHGIVIGETAVIGEDVSMLHNVTLGGTGKALGDRHPKIGDGVLIGAGAKILGNIRVGSRSRVAAGSVVLSEVPVCTTVAGVPARVVGSAGCKEPAVSMEQRIDY